MEKTWRTWRGLWIVNMYGFPFYKTPWISCTPTKVLAFGVLWSRYETWNTGWSRITNTWRYVSNVIVTLLLFDRAIFSLNVIFPYLNTSQLHFTWNIITCGRGRPKKTCTQKIDKDCLALGLTETQPSDRKAWSGRLTSAVRLHLAIY